MTSQPFAAKSLMTRINQGRFIWQLVGVLAM